MKAIDLLVIVNEQCTPNESYLIYRNVVKPAISGLSDEEVTDFMQTFFLGADGVILYIDYSRLRETTDLIVLYPTEEDGELYHDFAPIYHRLAINEEALFEGKLDNGQLVYIFNLE